MWPSVLVALSARTLQRDGIFAGFCNDLAVLLPLPPDSELLTRLGKMEARSIVLSAVRAAKAARIERGLPRLTEKHYRTIADESL